MAFRTFVYLDEKKLEDYLGVLGKLGENGVTRRAAKAGANFGVVTAEAVAEKSNRPQAMLTSMKYDLLEESLSSHLGDDYFDLLTDDWDIKTLPGMSIVRCVGRIEVPDSFDALNMASKYLQPLLAAGMVDLQGDPGTNEFALSLFERVDVDVPILIDGNEVLISSKLKTSNFVDCNYQVLEDYEDEDLFFLFKVHHLLDGERVVVFDPAKDFLKLNRTLRRNMAETKGFEKIVEKGPILKVEVIAIYH